MGTNRITRSKAKKDESSQRVKNKRPNTDTKKRASPSTSTSTIRKQNNRSPSPAKKPKSTAFVDTSYLDAATATPPPKVWTFQETDTFTMAKKLKEEPPVPLETSADDITIPDKSKIAGIYMSHLYASIMVGLPNDNEAPQQEAPLAVLTRVNEMLKPLNNKFPDKIWIAPWSLEDEDINDKTLRHNVASNDDDDPLSIAEKYIHDFNRFQSWGRRSYMRIHILHDPSIHASQILAQTDLCSIKGPTGQFFQRAHSQAKDPIAGGTLTGSVEEMALAKDFVQTFQQKWNLKDLGLYWSFLRSKKKGTYTVSKNAIHIEINRTDEAKLELIKAFFNQKSTTATNQFWGTPMQWVPQWDYRVRDEVNDSIERNKDSQHKLGMNLRSCSVRGVNLYNMLKVGDSKKTLHQQLMELESVHDKYVEIHTDQNGQLLETPNKKAFKGRLFYAIIPQSDAKTATFYYSQANAEEARSVARALPRFISTNLEVNAKHFCTAEFIAESKNGQWFKDTRIYRSEDDIIEKEKLDQIDQSMSAVKEIFIDPSQQRAFAADGDSIDLTINTQLTQGDVTATPAYQPSDASTLTGNTRESKVKRAVIEVTKQFQEREKANQGKMKSEITLLREALAKAGIQFPHLPVQGDTQQDSVTDSDSQIVALQKEKEDEASTDDMSDEEELQEPHYRPDDSNRFNALSESDSEDSFDHTKDTRNKQSYKGERTIEIDGSEDEAPVENDPKSKYPSDLSNSSFSSEESKRSTTDKDKGNTNQSEHRKAKDKPTPGGPRGGKQP